MKFTRRLGESNIGIGIRFTSGLAFTFIGLLILGCALLINLGLGVQRAMLEASGISYEQRLLVESMDNKFLFLFSNLKARDMSDDTIDHIRQDIVRMNASAQLNQKRLRTLMASHLAARWLTGSRTRDPVGQHLDEVGVLLGLLDRRVQDINRATIPALRAGYNYWRPVDVLTADKGRLTAGIGELNIAIYQASLHQNRLVFLLYGALLILVLAGVWLIWFLTLRPLGVRLERNYREIREKNASLAFQANHDTLTGLLNRTAFMQHMNALGRSGHLHEQTALILADVDNFKSINDNHGHHAGDRVLMEFARRLGLEQGDNESLYRLSGDEFAVVMTAVSGRQQVVARAEQILRNLRQKITLSGSGYDLPISGSLGGAWGRSCGASLEEMFSAADMALHHVKNNGRNHFALFDEVSGLAISHILEMEQELYQAVEQRAFVLYYQPIVDIRDNALIRLEALLRWRHPQRGILEPERWMPVAERLSILSEINLQVFDILEQDIRRWQAMNLACVPVNINITESLLLSGLVVDRIRELMQEPGMACHIGIEVTESVILDRSIKLARSQLERIRAAGIHIALDDFGTGFANLSHLNSIPYDAIKIDQSFVRIIPEDRGMRLIIESMIALLERLGKEVVCEGVENETVRDLLIRMGCRYSQGFLHARPLPFEQVCHWLKHRGVGHE